MNLFKQLTALLLGSVISLSVGGVLLLLYNLVPVYLLDLTTAAIAVPLVLSFFVYKGNILAVNVSTILGVVAPLMSISTPAHVEVLFSLGQNLLLSILGILQFVGFYVFPISFIILRVVNRRQLFSKPKDAQSKSSEDVPKSNG